MKLITAILSENNLKYNTLFIYSFYNNNNNNNNNKEKYDNNIDIKIDCECLEKYIYRERDPVRINAFEKLLWKSTTCNDNSNKVFWKSTDVVRQLINHYFNKNDDNNNNNKELINLILQDFYVLCKRYKNYEQFLLYEYESLSQRKFLLNLVLFMEGEEDKNKGGGKEKDKKKEKYIKKNVQKINHQIELLMSSIIQLWHLINIEMNVLENEFIPLAFSKWYKNYPFYKDFFCIITKNDIKYDFYKSFLDSITQTTTTTTTTTTTIVDIVNENIKNILKKYSHKMFYALTP